MNARPGFPPTLQAALADLERWPLPGPDWEPLRIKTAMILKAAFTTRGSPVPVARSRR